MRQTVPAGPKHVHAGVDDGVAFDMLGGTVPDARAHARPAPAPLRKRGKNGSR